MIYHLVLSHCSTFEKVLLDTSGQERSFPKNISSIQDSLDLVLSLENLDLDFPCHLKIFKAKKEISLPAAHWYYLKDITELEKPLGSLLCQAIASFWHQMPHEKSTSLTLPSFLYKINTSKEVTFYGGSFNPWHEGHLACLNLCPNDNIVVVPDYNPWKTQNQEGVGGQCRWKTFRELALILEKTPYSLYPGFWGVKSPNPTIDWLSKTTYSNKSLLMGDDSLFQFEKWKEAKKLSELVTKIYVAPRGHSAEAINDQKSKLEKTFPKLKIEILSEHPFQSLSSTELRKKN